MHRSRESRIVSLITPGHSKGWPRVGNSHILRMEPDRNHLTLTPAGTSASAPNWILTGFWCPGGGEKAAPTLSQSRTRQQPGHAFKGDHLNDARPWTPPPNFLCLCPVFWVNPQCLEFPSPLLKEGKLHLPLSVKCNLLPTPHGWDVFPPSSQA